MLEPRPTVSFLRGSLVLTLGFGCRTASAAFGSEGEVGMAQLGCVGISAAVGGVVVGRQSRGQEPVPLRDGRRDVLAVGQVRWPGGGCSSPVTAVMVSGGGAAVVGAGAMAAASRRGAVRARLLAAAMLRRRAAGVHGPGKL